VFQLVTKPPVSNNTVGSANKSQQQSNNSLNNDSSTNIDLNAEIPKPSRLSVAPVRAAYGSFNAPSPSSPTSQTPAPPSKQAVAAVDAAKLKAQAKVWLMDDEQFRKEVEQMLGVTPSSTSTTASNVNVDEVLYRAFPGGLVTSWNTTDNQGTVYGFPEEIYAKVVKHNQDVYIVPLYQPTVGNGKVDKADIAVILRIGQLYELMNRFTLGNNRVKIVVLAAEITSSAEHVTTQIGLRYVKLQ